MSDIQAVMRRIYGEVFTQGKIDVIDELMHDDFVEHEELPPGIPPGREAPKAMTAMMRSAFPDFGADVEDMLQDGNEVIARARFSGTHQGEFMGISATGNTFDIGVIDIIEFRGDKAIAHWGLMDTAKMMEQLGVGAPRGRSSPYQDRGARCTRRVACSDMTTPFDRPPAWVRDAVFYQIFPDRFARSDRVAKPGGLQAWDEPPTSHGYKGGDLLGIVEHLDHLTDLGVDAIYLNPIFQSASNHRYHTHDYFHVDPLLGGNDAFDEMLAACHDRGIRVVLDGVFNHASRGFFQFHDLLENGEDSPWADWFHVYDWPLNPYGSTNPANYAAWWGIRALPKFNTENPETREYLMQVGEHWARKGIDGWRLDVPEEIQTPGFWEEFRERTRAINPDLYIVGEIWANAAHYIADGTRFDGTMNYQLATAIIAFVVGPRVEPATILDNPWYSISPPIDAATYGDRIDSLLASYPEQAHLANLNLLDSHDTARMLSIASDDVASVELAFVLLMTFPGAPCIYYGTEIGMTGFRDPDNRGGFTWEEERWDGELLRTVKELIALRKDHPALRSSHYRRIWPPPADHGVMICVFERRSDDGEELIVAVNAGTSRETLSLPLSDFPGDRLSLLWGSGTAEHGEHNARLSMPARSGAVWTIE